MECRLSQNSGWGRLYFWGLKRNFWVDVYFIHARMFRVELYFEVDGVLFLLEQNFSLQSIFNLESMFNLELKL